MGVSVRVLCVIVCECVWVRVCGGVNTITMEKEPRVLRLEL